MLQRPIWKESNIKGFESINNTVSYYHCNDNYGLHGLNFQVGIPLGCYK